MYCLSSQLEQNPAVLEPFEQGVEITLKGNYLGAVEAFDRALLVSPYSADIYGHRCVARHKLGDNEGAIADCQRAADLYQQQGNAERHRYAQKSLSRLQKVQSHIAISV